MTPKLTYIACTLLEEYIRVKKNSFLPFWIMHSQHKIQYMPTEIIYLIKQTIFYIGNKMLQVFEWYLVDNIWTFPFFYKGSSRHAYYEFAKRILRIFYQFHIIIAKIQIGQDYSMLQFCQKNFASCLFINVQNILRFYHHLISSRSHLLKQSALAN